MAETASKKAAAAVSAEDFEALRKTVTELAEAKAQSDGENQELRALLETQSDEIQRLRDEGSDSPEAVARRKAAYQHAQDIMDFVAGVKVPTEETARSVGPEKAQKGQRLAAIAANPPTRKEIADAIRTIRTELRRRLAATRGLAPEEVGTMTNGIREHIALLHESANAYFDREDI